VCYECNLNRYTHRPIFPLTINFKPICYTHSEIIFERLSIMIESIFSARQCNQKRLKSNTKQYTIPRCPHFQEKGASPSLRDVQCPFQILGCHIHIRTRHISVVIDKLWLVTAKLSYNCQSDVDLRRTILCSANPAQHILRVILEVKLYGSCQRSESLLYNQDGILSELFWSDSHVSSRSTCQWANYVFLC